MQCKVNDFFLFSKQFYSFFWHSFQLLVEIKVRMLWDDEQEKGYFCVMDVVKVLTESKNPSDYIKKIKKRDTELAKGGTNCHPPLITGSLRKNVNDGYRLY